MKNERYLLQVKPNGTRGESKMEMEIAYGHKRDIMNPSSTMAMTIGGMGRMRGEIYVDEGDGNDDDDDNEKRG